MMPFSTDYGLALAAILFSLGLLGVLIRRNAVFILMSLEIMLNSAALAFIVAAAKWGQPDGQIMFIFILSVAAAEVSVGLALIFRMNHQYKTLDADALSQMRG